MLYAVLGGLGSIWCFCVVFVSVLVWDDFTSFFTQACYTRKTGGLTGVATGTFFTMRGKFLVIVRLCYLVATIVA